ncbi:hypothetical protein CCACVL1_13799 [Corchorus capsularis]|uniref:Uncharacterized protein n=1 Tax=Corchorus capsularis TaxID=210143 RepID=A0A1R3I9K2_COCAP|nr:hypothetical protein CCACVL1_13799 [Corchorus capsularis]
MADFKEIDSEPTLRRSRREGKKTPLWGLWKDEDQTPMDRGGTTLWLAPPPTLLHKV